MILDDDKIDENVRVLVGALLKGIAVTKDQQVQIHAAADLVVNLLQNINDLAYYASFNDGAK